MTQEEPPPAPHSVAFPGPVRYWFVEDVALGLASVGTDCPEVDAASQGSAHPPWNPPPPPPAPIPPVVPPDGIRFQGSTRRFHRWRPFPPDAELGTGFVPEYAFGWPEDVDVAVPPDASAPGK